MPAVEAAVRSTRGVLASKQRDGRWGSGTHKKGRWDHPGSLSQRFPTAARAPSRLRGQRRPPQLDRTAPGGRQRPWPPAWPFELVELFFFLQLQADARRDCDFKNLEKHLDPSSRGVVEQVCVRAWCHPPLRQCCGRYNRASVQRWLLCGWQLADVRGCAQCILPLRICTKILLAVSRTFPSRPAPRSARNAAPHTPLRRNLAGRLHREHGSTPTGVGHTRIVFDVAVCRPDPRPRPLQHLVGRSRGRRYTDTSVHHMPRLA